MIVKQNRQKAHRPLHEISRANLVGKTAVQSPARFDRSKGYNTSGRKGVDFDKLLSNNLLVVTIHVGDYEDTIAFPGFLTALKDVIGRQNNTNVNLQTVIQAIAQSIDNNDLLINCTCPDFCLHGDTEIKLLNGEVVSVSKMKEKFDSGEKMWVYSTDENGDFVPSEVEDVWVSGYSTEMVEVTLDNGKKIITTPNHRYMMRDGSYESAENLKEKQSLMPLYFSYHNGYESVKLNTKTKSWVSVYKTVADKFLKSEIEKAKSRSGETNIAIHHSDFNKTNNNPTNLKPLGKLEHWKYHSEHAVEDKDRFENFRKAGLKYWKSAKGRKQKSEEMSQTVKKYWGDMTEEERSEKLSKMRETSFFCQNDMSSFAKSVWDNLDDSERLKRGQKSIKPLLEYWNSATDFQKKNTSKKISESHKKAYAEMTEDEHRIATEQIRSLGKKPKSEVTKEKMSASALKFYEEHGDQAKINSTKHLNNPEMQTKSKIGKYKFSIDCMLTQGVELTEENYEKYKRRSDPHVKTYFESFDKVLEYFGVCSEYNHKIVSVKRVILDTPISVYDISVKDTHNFLVDAGVILHNCYRFAYWATKWGYKYGDPETRPTKITNPADQNGAMCKHLTAALKNKRWIVRLASIVNGWINTHFKEVLDKIGLESDEVFKGTAGRPSNRTGRNLGMLPLRSPEAQDSQDDDFPLTDTSDSEANDDTEGSDEDDELQLKL